MNRLAGFSATATANTARACSSVRQIASVSLPDMRLSLRHACGCALANAGHDTRRIQDWLRHKSIQHTTRYTQLTAAPFKDFWR
jgi:site-specific recombinase XerD